MPSYNHLKKENKTAKFNLECIELVKPRGFNALSVICDLRCADL